MRVLHYLINYVLMPRSTGHSHVKIDDLVIMIFNYLEIDVSGESGRIISQNNIIDERTIHHMGRGMDEDEEQQEPPPPQEQAGLSKQPSMRDMMQVLLRIEQNQANMDTHLTRVDQRLSRIEQYLEIDEEQDQD
ncbi:hypothetical protein PIB30_096189 [Stylosanthes scabra]|uniref:Uncharacterized protein n=1 Tax=Stylosanthes scabra TaxID=79078 RepID=A0ABU6TWP1_9FABA|nr:hypothetical protein [Stylosanthes scabra]